MRQTILGCRSCIYHCTASCGLVTKTSADDRSPLADVSAPSLPRSATCQPPPQVSTAAGPAWSARPFPPALPSIRRSSPPCLRRRRPQQVKPRHQFVYTRADARRLYRSAKSPEISTHRFARVPRVFCLCTAYLLVEWRFLRHSRLHSAYM